MAVVAQSTGGGSIQNTGTPAILPSNVIVDIDPPVDLAGIQPLYAFVQIQVGGVTITDFMDDLSDTVIDFTYTRKGHFDNKSQAGSQFAMTLYDDTALEIEELIASSMTEGFHLSYGWAYQGHEKYAARDLYGITAKYGLSFEGASVSLTLEGSIQTYIEGSEDQKTFSYDPETYQGKPSEIVKAICNENGWEIGLIEETEVVYDDDGSVKTFNRLEQDSVNFCQSLVEVSVSVETGIQGYRFFIGEDAKVYFVSISNTQVPAEASAELASSVVGSNNDVGNTPTNSGGSGGTSPQIMTYASREAVQPEVDPQPTQTGNSPSSQRYWLGDSRFNGMSSLMGSNDTLIAKDGGNYSYFSSTALPELKRNLSNKAGETVILGFGVNDVYNAGKYISAYQSLMNEYPNVNFVIPSVTPVYEGGTSSVTNAQIEDFNAQMKSAFPNNYEDIYTSLKGQVNAGNTDGMGVHYTTPAMRNTIYSMMSNAAGGSSGTGSVNIPTSSGNPVDSGNTGTPDINITPMQITRKYEYYSGQRNNTVISFTPEYPGRAITAMTVAEGRTIDKACNEMIECSIDGGSLERITGEKTTRVMGLSSSSQENLKQKAANMWNYFVSAAYGATLEIMGDPTVKVGSYIYITVYTKYGYPHHTSGIYYVKQAEDSITGGQFTTTLSLYKVGTSVENMQYFDSDSDTVVGSGQPAPDGGGGNTGTLPSTENMSGKAAGLINAAYSTPTAGAGYCAAWVSNVYQNAGLGRPGGNACDQYWNFCKSSDLNDLEPGMIVAVPSHTHSTAGQQYGHVAIYIGNGMVRENIGKVKDTPLENWISYYGTTYTPKWGWAG